MRVATSSKQRFLTLKSNNRVVRRLSSRSMIAPTTLKNNGDRIDVYNGRTKVLAPLVGGSDLSYRLLARSFGAQVTFTEMCVADYYLRTMKGDRQKLKTYTYEFDPTDRPLVLQLTGSTAAPIIELANNEMFRGHIDMVDLNCGCPQPFAMESCYGAALLRNVDHLTEMCKEIVQNIPYPLSVKCRLHENLDTTIALIKRLHQVGVNHFTLHGRYHWQRGEQRGKADWNAIRELRNALPETVTIIGNGDITRFEDFQRMMETTRCNAMMVGYGALLNPTIFSNEIVPLNKVIERYISIARRHQNKYISILRHLAWLLKSTRLAPQIKAQLFETRSLQDIQRFLASLEPPVIINIEEGIVDKISYPKPLEHMSASKLAKHNRLREKAQRKLARRCTANPDEIDDLVAG